ncbi:MAG: Cdc6/Cdc18 family protein [Candidatus Hermodarchaeota archaeon]
MTIDFFEELLKKPSIFLDESKLDINFVPKRLPHRDKELSLLSQLFLTLITNPYSISRTILITGKTGIGKTATVKLFGDMLINASKKRNLLIRYVHVNCRKEKTSYKVLIRIIRALNKNFPKRGYSPQDLLEIIIDFLNYHDSYLLIVLDELNYLINKKGDLIYSLTRVNDDSVSAPQRVSIIGIVRDISCLNNLDASTMSTLQRNIIKFKMYSKSQIFDILRYRAEISIKKNAFTDEIIDSISDLVLKNGDIRYGLNLLWRASKIAEGRNLKCITNECVRLGNQDLVPFSTKDTLQFMSSQKLIFLLSIIKGLKKSKKSKISLPETIEFYNILCENLNKRPKSYSQLWNYLQDFKRENLLSISIKSESIKGRKAFINVQDVGLSTFEKVINNILNFKGITL